MAQSWSLSVLGWVPGIITMILAGLLFWITSMTMWKYIMKYPQIKDICKLKHNTMMTVILTLFRRFWLLRFWQEQNSLRVQRFHVAS
jgi:hypothetical protein